jgi:hypothetical protein
MHNRHIVINMTINGEKSPAFSAITLDLPEHQFDETPTIVHHSRANYSKHRTAVEQYIKERYALEDKPKPKPQPAPKPTPSPAPSPAPVAQTTSPPTQQHPSPAQTSPKDSAATVGKAAISASEIKVKLKRRRRRRQKKSTDGLADNTEHVIFTKDK